MGVELTCRRLLLLVAALLATAHPAPANAEETWLIAAEAPAALPVSDPQTSLFGPGGMPSFGVYRSLGRYLLIGARLRAGALTDGEAPEDMTLADPDAGGLGSVSLNMRARPLAGDDARRGSGLWLEISGGAGVTGDQTRPTFEAGLGWGFRIGSANVGPSLRYLYIHEADGPLSSGAANLALIGVELTLFDARDVAPPPTVIVAEPEPPVAPEPEPEIVDSDGDGLLDDVDACPDKPEDIDEFEDDDGCPDPDNDGDKIADLDDDCPLEPEVVNGIDDTDGCPDEGLIVMIEDRIVLEERVLFDPNRARVKSRAKPSLLAIIELWKQHPEWDRMIIEGHADKRGTKEYNLWLSELRAQRVKDKLIELGMPGDVLEAVGMGESRPVSTRSTAKAHQKNRRVEFVIIEEHQQIQRVDTGDEAKASDDESSEDAK